MKYKLFLTLIALALAWLGYRILFADSPEQKALKAYARLEAAFEDRSLMRVRANLDEKFQIDGLGGVSEALLVCQRYFFDQVQSVKVSSDVRIVNSNPDLIQLAVIAHLSGTDLDGGRWRGVSEGFDRVSFTLIMRKKDGHWRPTRMIPEEKLREAIKSMSDLI